MSAAGGTSLRWCGECCWGHLSEVCSECCPCLCREELKALRKQMAEIEKSMTEQLFTNQQRAQEAYVSVPRLPCSRRQRCSDCCCACVCRVS